MYVTVITEGEEGWLCDTRRREVGQVLGLIFSTDRGSP